MTLCIAAQSGLSNIGERMFIHCWDGRMSEGAWGSNDATIKSHRLGYNFFGLMAGHWNTVRQLCAHLQRDMRKQIAPDTIVEVMDRVEESSNNFCATRLCGEDVRCEVLVTGFVGNAEPVMLRLTIESRKAATGLVHDINYIGEGEYAAQMLLKYRGYDSLARKPMRACYLIYEAKRFAESVDSVGSRTAMAMHLPLIGPNVDDYRLRVVPPKVMQVLEELRTQFFVQSVTDIEPIIAHFD